MTSRPVRIGTRASPLALVQAGMVRSALRAAHPDLPVAVVPLSTRGDRVLERPLAEIGGKGLFTEEIEAGLAAGELDVAVHSMKDLPTRLPHGLTIGAMLPRADPRDVLIARRAAAIADLPAGAVVGTASLRRKAQLLALRPDLRIAVLRGNVQTRLRRLAEGVVHATLLARAGLDRLGLTELEGAVVLEPEEMLPAVAQGAIGIECRADDATVLGLLARIADAPTMRCVACERALLDQLDGSCRTPIAALAELDGEGMRLRALVATPDGTGVWRTERAGVAVEAEMLGADAGRELRRRGGAALAAVLGATA